ncbi:MAG: hypothetical protein RBS43_04725 [Candidatus Cloacimonas sp.]|jgi:hypothetical protein|nr:hypothetical protein [Candidatus Cloacimonas sp.]
MPREIKIKSIRNSLPVRYRYTPVVRGFMLALSLLISAYSLYFMVRFVRAETPMFFKLLPLIIMFVSVDSIFRQITSLNCICFYEDRLCFSYIAKRKVEIPYTQIRTMELVKKITFYLKITYSEDDQAPKEFRTPASFPKILEIIVNIADMSPNVVLSGMLSKAVEHLRSKAEAEDAEQV